LMIAGYRSPHASVTPPRCARRWRADPLAGSTASSSNTVVPIRI
jgi:hypothetical protein